MQPETIMQLIERDAQQFYLSPSDALPAFVEILAEHAGEWNTEDLATLVAVGSLLYREAHAENMANSFIASIQQRASANVCPFATKRIPD